MINHTPRLHLRHTLFFASTRISAAGYPDCTHYCLPGVPDVWTQLLHDLVAQSPFFSFSQVADS
jgi:hypothetical protein